MQPLTRDCEGMFEMLGKIEKLSDYSAASTRVSAVKGLSMRDVARICGLSWTNARDCIKILEKMGVVERFGNGKYAVYSFKIGKNKLVLMP
jgi:predicted transcriptional regulator of viral defense system